MHGYQIAYNFFIQKICFFFLAVHIHIHTINVYTCLQCCIGKQIYKNVIKYSAIFTKKWFIIIKRKGKSKIKIKLINKRPKLSGLRARLSISSERMDFLYSIFRMKDS